MADFLTSLGWYVKYLNELDIPEDTSVLVQNLTTYCVDDLDFLEETKEEKHQRQSKDYIKNGKIVCPFIKE